MPLLSNDVEHPKSYNVKIILLGVIALIIAAVASWYITLFVLYDVGNHYPNGDTIVRITSTGEKYHFSSCQYLHSSSIKISLEDAYERGYNPCSKCDPPNFISTEDYKLAKAKQPLALLIVGTPLICILVALISVLVIGKIYDFFGLFYTLPDWFAVLLICVIYVSTLMQGFRVLIIW